MKPLSTGTGLKDRLRQFDICLLICTSVLSIMSLLLMYSISDTLGFGLLRMQAASTLVGVFVMVFLATVDYQEVVNKLWVIFLIGEIGLLCITLVFGIAEGENQSWLEIGPITIQPSEFVKGTFIVTFSKHLDIVKHKINHPLSLLGLGMHAGAIIGLILISGDLGVALVYCGIVALMLFCAGLSLFYFLGAGVAAFVAIPYAWDFLKEYQKKRIIYGFNPEADPEDTGYQALLGRDALANGGFFGQGINGGTYYKGLFACENDFAFSTLCEKFGLACGILVLICLAIIVIRVFMIARTSRKDSGAFLCIGVAAAIVVQTIENVGMCLAMLPVIGITLPFISYGGSSTLAMYLLLGMVHSVKTHRVKYNFEREHA